MAATRVFFVASAAAALSLLLLALWTVISASLPETPPASASAHDGFTVWRDQGCAGCHTLAGVGGGYAPDLTHIVRQRSDAHVREFLFNPGAFQSPNSSRVMPRHALTADEARALLDFLRWISDQPHTQDFPPAPLLILADAAPPDAAPMAGETPTSAAERGRALFSLAPANCAACHSLEPGVTIVGPSLAGIAARAASRVLGQDAQTYLRNAILYPSDYVVEGYADAMAKNLGALLTSAQVDDLIAYLLTLG